MVKIKRIKRVKTIRVLKVFGLPAKEQKNLKHRGKYLTKILG